MKVANAQIIVLATFTHLGRGAELTHKIMDPDFIPSKGWVPGFCVSSKLA